MKKCNTCDVGEVLDRGAGKCRDCLSAYRRQYRKDNRDKVLSRERSHREKNRDRYRSNQLSYSPRYRAENRKRLWCSATIGGHRRSGYEVNISIEELLQRVESTTHCTICGCLLDWNKIS